jgi:WD40 repeat protein
MLRRLVPALLAAVWLAPSVADAQVPQFGFDIKSLGPFEFDWGAGSGATSAAGPALIVLTGGPDGDMYASGVGGDLWTASKNDQKFEAGPLVDSQACLAMAADDRRLVTAGIGANVRVWILPSECLGTIKTLVHRGIAADGATQRIATLHKDSLLIRQRGRESTEAELPASKIAALTSGDAPEFTSVAWVAAPRSESPYVLAGSDAGHIAAWTARDWAADPIILKAIAPDSGSDEEMPAIKCVVSAGRGQILTGDASGYLRRWQLPQIVASEPLELPSGTPAIACDDGLRVITFDNGTLSLRAAESLKVESSIATDRNDRPEFMIHRRLAIAPADGSGVDEIVLVWPIAPSAPAAGPDAPPADPPVGEDESAAAKHAVGVYAFPTSSAGGPALRVQPRLTGIVTGTLRAVAAHPAEAGLAVATSEIGTQFVDLTAAIATPPVPPPGDAPDGHTPDEADADGASIWSDDAYVALHYSADGKRLYEVVSEDGSTRITQYNANDQSSGLQSSEFPVTVTASAPYDDALESDSSARAFLFLGTDDGKLNLVQFEPDPANPAVATAEIIAAADTSPGNEVAAVHARGNRVVVVASTTATILQVAASEPRLRFLERQAAPAGKDVRLAESLPRFVVVGETIASRPTYALAVSDALGGSVNFLAGNDSGAVYGALSTGAVFDLSSASPTKLQDAGVPQITSLAVSPDGKHLLAGIEDQTSHHIRHWSLGGSQPPVTDSRDAKHRITALSISADSMTFFAGRDDGNAAQFAMAPMEQLKLNASLVDRSHQDGSVIGFAVLPPMAPRNADPESSEQAATRLARSDRVFVALSTDITSVWTLKAVEGFRLLPGMASTTALVEPPPGSYGSPYFSVVENRTLKKIAAAGSDGFLRIWEQPGQLQLNKDFNPNRTFLTPAALDPVSSVPLYATALQATHEAPIAGQPEFAVFAGGADGNIYRAAGDQRNQVPAFEPPAMVYALAAHPSLPFIAVGAGARKPISTPAEASEARAESDKTIRIWTNALDPVKVLDCNGHKASIISLAFSPGGELLASVDANGKIRLWDCRDLAAAALPSSLPSEEVALSSAGRSVDWRRGNSSTGMRLAVGCTNGEVHQFTVTPK